jgi:hypothetical protein
LGITIDTIGRGKIEKQYEEALRYLSDTTGGQFVHARPDRLPLPDALERIYEGLLETRSRVVYFKYEADKEGRTLQNASIELKQLGQYTFRSQIPGAIPAPIPPPPLSPPSPLPTPPPSTPPSSIISKWVWLFAVALLVLGLAVWLHRRTTSQDQWVKEIKPLEPNKPEIKPPLVVSPELSLPPVVPAEPSRKTQVGSYYFPVPKPGYPTAILKGVSGPVEGQRFPVDKEVFHIGASPENDLLIANDEYVSGDHAYICYEEGNYFIVDKGSRNGTFVNQHAVTSAGFALGLGDHIQVGMSTFEVVIAPS